MNDANESLSEEASAPMTRFLSAKSWNVQTLFDTSKLSQVIKEVED